METFLSSVGQHLTSFFNLSLMKSIDTGDRMLDTTLQMLLSTILGGVITFLVSCLTKGLWKEHINQLYAITKIKDYNPLIFDANLAPDKPLNGISHLYELRLKSNKQFISWFYTHHSDKKFKQKRTHSIAFPDSENLLDLSSLDIISDDVHFDNEIPVWRGQDGYYVYVKNIRSSYKFAFYSDSGDSMKDCFEHYTKHISTIKNFEAERKNRGDMQKIWEYSADFLIERGQIELNRNFDSLFFNEKQTIMNVLSNFKNGTLFPKHLPIDNKLGIILYGPPGTGKTGFIAAVANYLQRNILLVNMNRIKTRKELDEVLSYDRKTHIWVFEEFDCAAGVARRTDGDTTTDGGVGKNELSAYTVMLLNQKEQSEGIMKELREEKAALNDKLDLQYLLTKLDGLESASDRLIIATTNHPERIDPALLRPGRFGIQINLTYCNKQMIKEIICMIYQLESDSLNVDSIKENIWTPAELIQLGITKGSAEALIEYLNVNLPERLNSK